MSYTGIVDCKWSHSHSCDRDRFIHASVQCSEIIKCFWYFLNKTAYVLEP